MRACAEGKPLGSVTGYVEPLGILKMLLVAIGGSEHQEHALLGLERDIAYRPLPGDPARRHPDRRDPAGVFLERLQPRHFASERKRELVGMGEQRPHGTSNRIARFVLAAADSKLDVGAHAFHRHVRRQHYAEQALVWLV